VVTEVQTGNQYVPGGAAAAGPTDLLRV
jgi:hypothetical protein